MRTFLVVNPNSGNGQTGRRWAELSGRISRRLGDFTHAFTRGPMDAARIAREAVEEGHECVVAVGGDGTVSEVVNGLVSEDGTPLREGVTLGVIPRGTGGDFRKTFGWGLSLEESLERIASDRSRPLDVGAIEYVDHEGRAGRRFFVNICSFGVSGLVDKKVNESSKVLGGKLSFMLGSAKAMLEYRDKAVRVSLDGAEAQTMKVTTLAVGNGRYFGGGMCVTPDADPSDGRFDVTVWSGYGMADFVLKGRAIYSGAHVKMKGTTRLHCTRLHAEPVGDDEVLLDIDGEQPGRLPCSIGILPGALRLKG